MVIRSHVRLPGTDGVEWRNRLARLEALATCNSPRQPKTTRHQDFEAFGSINQAYGSKPASVDPDNLFASLFANNYQDLMALVTNNPNHYKPLTLNPSAWEFLREKHQYRQVLVTWDHLEKLRVTANYLHTKPFSKPQHIMGLCT